MSVLKTKLLTNVEKKEFALLMWNIGKLHPEKYFHQTLAQWAEEQISSKRNQELFYMYCRLASYAHAPQLVNAGVVLRQLKLSLGGAFYINRGWQMVINQLREKAESYGITLLNKVSVEEVNHENSTKCVVYRENGEWKQLETKWIVSTVSPQETMRLMKVEASSRLGHLLNNSKPVRAACLDVTLSRLTNPNQHFSLELDQALYYSNHSHAAKLSYHPNHQIIHVMKYLTQEEESASEHVLASFLEKNQPGWQKHVVTKRFLPSIIVSQRLHEVGTEDIMKCAEQEIPGLILASEWVSNEYMLAEGALQTAKLAANKIIMEKEYGEIGCPS